jgi:hypothetical protein
MFCPSCGFEYAQKTNYCKRCGVSLSVPSGAGAPETPRTKIVGMFWAIAMFCLFGLVIVFRAYDRLANKGLRGDDLTLPFMMSLLFIGLVAGLLIWMLARMIGGHQKAGRDVIVEKHFIRESPPAQLGAHTDQIQQGIEPPSVVEHTTRQMAGGYREPAARG